jgi:hypothetical protein
MQKPTTDFRFRPNGLHLLSWCNPCRAEYHREARKANRKEREQKVCFRPFGEKSHKAKLTNDDARLIKQLISAGLPLQAIGEKFDVARTTISDIKHGNSWTHV